MMFELMTSGVLLGVVMTSILPTLGWIARQRQFSRHHQAALLEVGNLMERVSLLDWDELTTERTATFEVSETLRRQLPDAQVTIEVTDNPDDRAKLVRIELRWESAAGRPAPPVRLAAWFHEAPSVPGKRH